MKTLFTLARPARLENLEDLVKTVRDCAGAQGFGRERIGEIELICEEALVNICNYSYPEKGGDVEISCGMEGDDFLIRIADSGVPFDMASLPDPDTGAALEERRIGGLGIFLIKKMADAVSYRREAGRNILTLTIRKEKDREKEGTA